MKITCAYCGKEAERDKGHVNRSIKIGAPIYCNRTCAGFGRRISKTKEQKRAEKKEYDKQYRKQNIETIKLKKKAHYEANKSTILNQMREYRKTIMPRHVEYCRQPKYKEYKRQYDRKYRAQKEYGDFWEAAILVNDIEKEYDKREVFRDEKKYNYSAQKRKRSWKN